MKQILVATDFSSSAANAMKYAIEIAKVLAVDICAIHAIHPTEGINNSTYNAIFIEDYYNNKRTALKLWAEKLAEESFFPVTSVKTLCDVGFLKTVVTRYLKHNDVNLLVTGVIGATGITGIVGSNASMLVAKVKTPTLIIPPGSKFPETPVITLATDYETRLSAEDVNALKEMVKAFGSEKIKVLYVAEKSGLKHIETGETRLKNLIHDTHLDFNYTNNSSPLNGIMDFIQTHETDILCLVKHHHNIVYRLFNRSTVNQIMNQTVKAILVLHE